MTVLPAHIREAIERGALPSKMIGYGTAAEFVSAESEAEFATRIALLVAEDCARIAYGESRDGKYAAGTTAAIKIRASYGLKEKP